MRAFAIELLRFLATVWSRMWRWTLRKRRNFFITLIVAVFLLVIVSGVFSATPKPRAPVATPIPTPTATVKYTEIQANPVARGGAESSATPDADASTLAPEVPSEVPSEPVVNRESADSVARGFLTAYLARPSEEWAEWETWVAPYTMPTILDQVRGQAFHHPSVLEGKAPTAIVDIRVGEPEVDAETNTPIRWSHNLEVDVSAADGSVLTIVYGLVLADSDDGWTVTSVSEVAVSGD